MCSTNFIIPGSRTKIIRRSFVKTLYCSHLVNDSGLYPMTT